MRIEVDSDSDFAPGAYVPEVKPKKKARNSSAGPSSRKRRRIDIGTTSKEKSDLNTPYEIKHTDHRSSTGRRVTTGTSEPNPLLKYFGAH